MSNHRAMRLLRERRHWRAEWGWWRRRGTRREIWRACECAHELVPRRVDLRAVGKGDIAELSRCSVRAGKRALPVNNRPIRLICAHAGEASEIDFTPASTKGSKLPVPDPLLLVQILNCEKVGSPASSRPSWFASKAASPCKSVLAPGDQWLNSIWLMLFTVGEPEGS
jgi:hypothetical protein